MVNINFQYGIEMIIKIKIYKITFLIKLFLEALPRGYSKQYSNTMCMGNISLYIACDFLIILF